MERQVKVLFVCTGNICRSPTAEAVLRARAARRGLGDRILAASAGTHGYHIGEAPDPRTRAAASRRGYAMTGMLARRVTRADFAAFDLIVAMDSGHFAALERMAPAQHRGKLRRFMDFAPAPGASDVQDPYYGGAQGFEHVLDVIEAGIEALIDGLESGAVAGSRP